MKWLSLSPGDGGSGGEEGTSKAPESKDAPAAPKAKVQDSGPAPVPYEAFQKANKALREAEGRLASMDGWKAPGEVESLLHAEREKADLRVLLADQQVSPSYRDYMLGRVQAEKPEDTTAFLRSLKESEGAFFSGAAATPEAPPASAQPERSNPDKGTKASPPGAGRAVTAADIDAMSIAEYQAWKQAGGLDQLRGATSQSRT